MDTGSFIAIDSGGSRLRGYAWPSGKEFSGDGSTHTSSVALVLARNIADAIPEEITEVETIVLSLAGIPHKESDQELLAAAISQRVSFSKLLITTDTHAAALSLGIQSDFVITFGTGITDLIKKDDKVFDLTGHGYLIGDEASGYWIGRQGLNAALKGAEGRGDETSLTRTAQDFFQVSSTQLADYIHQLTNPVREIAAFAPLVNEAAENHDPVAISILNEAAEEIKSLIVTAIKRADIKSVALMGGAIPNGGLLHKNVLAITKDLEINFTQEVAEPLSGARKIALEPALQMGMISINTSEIKSKTWSTLYLENVQELLKRVSQTQEASIAQAVLLFSDALANGKMIHTFGTGHSHLLAEEIFYRAGGLAAIYPILDERLMLHKDVVKGSQSERLPGLAHELLAQHPITRGDVVVVISNSGGNQVTIDLVSLAHEAGATVIAVTSINHATSKSARSNNAQKIHQLSDVVLDNSGVVGDASIRIIGTKMAVAPTSTIIGGAMLQAVVVGTVAELIKRGIEPEIFLSSNMVGGDENNAAIFDKYRPLIHLYN
jgi:uncharacterized phosphosugar-binding protein/N-acetylglucosamine kinase-like BadF-type ATPase